MVLTNNLLLEECRWLSEQARIHANNVLQSNAHHPPGAELVPNKNPRWDYNTTGGSLPRDCFKDCLLAHLHKAALIPVNYEKLKIIIQDKENLSHFLEWFTKAHLQHTSLDPEIPNAIQLLITHLVSQNFPNFRAKQVSGERASETTDRGLVVDFKVYHGRDEKKPTNKTAKYWYRLPDQPHKGL